MKSFIFLLVLVIHVASLFALTPNTITTLSAGKTYNADDEGATYTITTNGDIIDACINVTKSATLILNNCHILTQGSGNRNAAININAPDVTLLVRFTGQNTLAIDSDNTAYSAISTLRAIFAPNIIFAEYPNTSQDHALFIRGCSTTTLNTTQCLPPINLKEKGSVTFRSGNITIATSEANATNPNGYKTIPSLASTGTVTIRSSYVTAQLCPRSTTGVLTNSNLIGDNFTEYVSPLFTCSSFIMTGGTLTTAGMVLSSSDAKDLKASTIAYDTLYAYPQNPFEQLIPTSDATQSITGGAIIGNNDAYFYGFPAQTSIPGNAFTHTGNKLLSNITANTNGRVKISGGLINYPSLALNYVANSNAQAIAELFGAPLVVTENGITASANFGISNLELTDDYTSLTLTLSLALDILDDNTMNKSLLIQVLQIENENDPITLYDGELTFSRDNKSIPFTTTFQHENLVPTVGKTQYTIRAYN
jgi:hypothetical protein